MRIDAIVARNILSPVLPGAPPPCRAKRGVPTWPFGLPAVTLDFRRNREIFGEGELPRHVYQVISGAARCFTVSSDGRRLVHAFYMPGDVFGIDRAEFHRASAEAVVDTKLLLVRRSVLAEAQSRDLQIALDLYDITCAELERLHERALLQGYKTAARRCAAFLAGMARRQSQRQVMSLVMSRLDIADYLGLTVETVSRTVTRFERDGLVELRRGRKVVLVDRDRLEALLL